MISMSSTTTHLRHLNFVCPVCDGENTIDYLPEIGELLDCSDCGSELEVSSTEPLEVIESDLEAEDWGQ